jgi:uncharacterized protein YciI
MEQVIQVEEARHRRRLDLVQQEVKLLMCRPMLDRQGEHRPMEVRQPI